MKCNIKTHSTTFSKTEEKTGKNNANKQLPQVSPRCGPLGPTLCTILHDGVLRLDLSAGVEQIAFVNHLTILVRSNERNDLMHKALPPA